MYLQKEHLANSKAKTAKNTPIKTVDGRQSWTFASSYLLTISAIIVSYPQRFFTLMICRGKKVKRFCNFSANFNHRTFKLLSQHFILITVKKYTLVISPNSRNRLQLWVSVTLWKREEYNAPWLQVNVIQWQMEQNGSFDSGDCQPLVYIYLKGKQKKTKNKSCCMHSFFIFNVKSSFVTSVCSIAGESGPNGSLSGKSCQHLDQRGKTAPLPKMLLRESRFGAFQGVQCRTQVALKSFSRSVFAPACVYSSVCDCVCTLALRIDGLTLSKWPALIRPISWVLHPDSAVSPFIHLYKREMTERWRGRGVGGRGRGVNMWRKDQTTPSSRACINEAN